MIAEAGVNHNGDVALAQRLVDVAADAGADAVKFQTFRAELVASASAPKAAYQAHATGAESQLDMLRRLELAPAAHETLQRRSAERGLVFLSTPFDLESLDLLDALDVAAFKVASGEITNLPFLDAIARRKRPVILSTGGADLREVETAVRTIGDAGNRELVLLHCVSAYPAEARDANLRAMQTLERAFDVPVGFSDHTRGLEVPLAAAALGAVVIEKHFTVSRELDGPDHRASLEPDELAALVRGIRAVEASLGTGDKRPAAAELEIVGMARRSLHVRDAAPAGTEVTRDMLTTLRPPGGIEPARWLDVVGRRLTRALPAGARLEWTDLA